MTGADFLQLDPRQAPVRGRTEWLTARLRAAVLDGTLAAGSVLPASRALAADLGWSRGVVVEAYQRLREEGLAEGATRAGTRVTAIGTRRPPATDPHAGLPAAGPRQGVLDLSPTIPDLNLFPRAAWLRAEREILTAAGRSTLDYGDPHGSFTLRAALAGWLATHRGIHTAPESIIVVSGVAQALALLATVLVREGQSRVAVEDPGSRGARDELAFWGLSAEPVPVDRDGIDVAALTATAARIVLVTPAHQYPTGVVLSPARRQDLIAWAVSRDGLVIEDDYDAEHRYDRSPVPALHARSPEHVVYAGSASKSLAPALRLGWIIPPERIRQRLVETKHASDITSPTLPQLILARMLESGEYDRHLRRARRQQIRRRNAMLEQLRRHLPQAHVEGVAAGLHLLVTFPDRDLDDLALARRLADDGVIVDPLGRHRCRAGAPGLVLGYAANAPDRIVDGIAVIAQAVRAVPVGG